MSWSGYVSQWFDSVLNWPKVEPTSDSDDEKHDGDDVDLNGTHLYLIKPRYKLKVLHKIRECGSQFTSLEVKGDWSRCTRDLIFIIPKLTFVRTVDLEFSTAPCKESKDVFNCIANLPLLECLNVRGMYYECECLEEIVSHPNLRRLYLNESSLQRNPDDLDTILFTVDPSYGNCRLVEFEGAQLNRYLRLWGLEEAGLDRALNTEILKFVRDLNARHNEEDEESDEENGEHV